ncbi:hypothetical protein JCM39194_25390 [Desulfotomaculum varum]
MLKILVAGPRKYIDRMQLLSKESPVKITRIAADLTGCLEIIESEIIKPAPSIDAVVLGFDDDDIEIIANMLIRKQVPFPCYISLEKPTQYRKWLKYGLQVVPQGKEFDVLEKLQPVSQLVKESVNFIDETRQQADAKVRIEMVQEKENQRKTVVFGKKVITIFGGKGGIGKTVISVSLAQSLAAANMKVCLLDLDCNRDFGDCLRYLGKVGKLKREAILYEEIPKWAKSVSIPLEKTIVGWKDFPWEYKHDEKIVTFCLVQQTNNLYLLPPFTAITEERYITAELVSKIIETLYSHFDVIVIDAGNTLSDAVITAMEKSTEILIVSSGDLAVLDSLTDFAESTLTRLSTQSGIYIIINDITPDNPFITNIEYELTEVTKGFQVAAKFSHDEKLKKMVGHKSQVPYLGAHDMAFVSEMKKLLCLLFPKELFLNSDKENKKQTGNWFSNFLKNLRIKRGVKNGTISRA